MGVCGFGEKRLLWRKKSRSNENIQYDIHYLSYLSKKLHKYEKLNLSLCNINYISALHLFSTAFCTKTRKRVQIFSR